MPKKCLAAINQVNTLGTRSALENASEKTAQIVDAEVKEWLDAAHADATRLLSKNKDTVQKLAEELLARETLTGDEIRKIVNGKAPAKKSAKKSTGKKVKQDAAK